MKSCAYAKGTYDLSEKKMYVDVWSRSKQIPFMTQITITRSINLMKNHLIKKPWYGHRNSIQINFDAKPVSNKEIVKLCHEEIMLGESEISVYFL